MLGRFLSLLFARSFGRTTAVGLVATAVDLSVLTLFVKGWGLNPTQGNIPALLAGVLVQFFGSRHFAFRAGSGPLGKQALGFVVIELLAFGINAAGYHLLILHTDVHFVLGRILCQAGVFALFSYPLWRLNFRVGSSYSEGLPKP